MLDDAVNGFYGRGNETEINDMTALFIKITKAPKCAPDAKAVVRVAEGAGFRYTYVDGMADARAFCRARDYDLEVAA